MRVYPIVNAVQSNRSQNDRSSNVSFGLFGTKTNKQVKSAVEAELDGFSNLAHYIDKLSTKEIDKLGEDAIKANDTDGFWRKFCQMIGFSLD